MAVGSSFPWRFCAFAELSLLELQGIFKARQAVFVVEQQCPYLDIDGRDELSFHLAAWSSAGAEMPAAYARVVPPGHRYEEPSIGRVLTVGSARGVGMGRELVRRAVDCCQQVFPGQGIRISAQSRLESFYAEFGFVSVGQPYFEDAIEHTEMFKL